MTALDPIGAVIAVAEAANAAHTALLAGIDESNDVQMRRANAAGWATDEAYQVVQQTMPATLAGVLALTEFYARDADLYERSSSGGDYLKHVASALAVFVARASQAEVNLPTLARCYGQVCGDLWVHRYLLEGVLEEVGEIR